MRLVACLVVLLVSGVAACDLAPRVTSDPARDQWAALAPSNRERLSQLRSRQTVVGGRVAALTVPPGVQDLALSQLISDLQGKVSALDGAITAVEQTVAQVGGEIESALGRRDKVGARKLIDLAGPRLDQAFATANAPFDAIEQQLPPAEAATSRHLATVAAEEQRLVRVAAEGGDVNVNVTFQGNELDVADPRTKVTFDRLVKLAGACDALRVTVSAHVPDFGSPAGKAAAAARADDIVKKLVAAGVPAANVTSGADREPSQSAEHVKLTVTAPCLPPPPPPGAMPPPPPPGAMPPPPTAERVPAPADPHAGHNH